MSRRSIAIALLGVAALAAVSFYNLYVLRNTSLVGSYLPVGVFGGLLLFALAARGLRRGAGSPAEAGAVVAVLLFACGIVGASLLDHASTLAMLPWRLERLMPDWRGDPAQPDATALRDETALARALARAADAPDGDPARAFARRIPEALRERARSPEFASDLAARDALRSALNAALADPALADEVPSERRPPLPDYVHRWLRRPAAERTPEEVLGINRALLDGAFPNEIVPRRPPVLDLVPPAMLADPSAAPAVAMEGFATGLGDPNRPFSIREVPWAAWRRTFLFWGPMILAMIVIVTGLAMVLHRQWSEHERLPYPVAEVARALLPEPGRPVAEVFRRRAFWVAFGLVVAIHGANYAAQWWPDYVIPVPLHIELRPLLQIAPVMQRHFPFQLFRPTVYFSAIGLAYLLSSDVAFSLGIGPYLFSVFVGIAAGLGYTFGGGFLMMSAQSQFNAGAYTAMFLAILYSGRHYYLSTARRAIGLPARDSVEAGAVWGARAAALGFAVFVGGLIAVGVEPALAVIFTLALVMVYTVLSRLLAEAGVFYMHSGFYPCVVLWSFLGTSTVGYEQMVLLGLVTAMVLSDPKDALMPFAMTGLRLAERCGARPAAVARWGAIGAALALGVAAPTMIYLQYRHGALTAGHPWMHTHVPRGAFARASTMTRTLQAQGTLGEAAAIRGLARFRRAVPQPGHAAAFVVFFALALLFTFLRHRFARWPLHPLLFLVMGTYQSSLMAFSVLLGWGVKGFVMKYGGARAYQTLKPAMIGLVAGEVMAAALPLAIGAIYAAIIGQAPPQFRILPG